MRTLLLAMLIALATPATASAADTVVIPDPAAERATALDGMLVWISGEPGAQRLMQRTPDGVIAAVKRAPTASSYHAIDLGHDRDGKLRLTYERCGASGCKILWDDLDGRRATFRNLEPPRCALSAVSAWGARAAYGLSCGGSARNRKLTGLYVKDGARPARRLPRPPDAVKHRIADVQSVDLRGLRVAAVVGDIYEYSFSQTVNGRDMRSIFAAASEGDGDGHVRGLAIQSAGTYWTLTNAEHLDDPRETILFRNTFGCTRIQKLLTPAASQQFAAIDVAVDGATLYLVKPGLGIVTHTFAADAVPAC